MREGLREVQETSKFLNFLYKNQYGRLVMKIFTSPFISKIVGIFMDSPLSVFMIKKFIRENNINMEDYQDEKYKSFNEFFTRRIRVDRRSIDMNPTNLIAPCDAKLTVHKIDHESKFRIKNSDYTIDDLLNGDDISEKYVGGQALIFRLTVDDYHRYCYIDSGTKGYNKKIKGELHTVKPIAFYDYPVFTRNSREYTILHTENFGNVVQIEVGAMMVGRISNNHEAGEIRRGQEKGKFEFGGSTIVLLFEKDRVIIDQDIINNSLAHMETKVKIGEKIGRRGI